MPTTEEQELYLAQQDAEKHWKWLEERFHKMFVDGYVHGAKHALQEKYTINLTEKK